MRLFAAVARNRRTAWLGILLASVVGALVFALPQPEPAPTGSSTGLPDSYQSVQVEQLQEQLPSADTSAALVVLSRGDGAALTSRQEQALADVAQQVSPVALEQRVAPPQLSRNGTVALIAVPLSTADDDRVVAAVDELRGILEDPPAGLQAQVTGGPAFAADLTAVFDGADITLLAVTASVVALLLLVTYRSPFLWIVPLAVVAAAEQTTIRLVEVVLPRLDLPVSGNVTGITSVLVFGAATNYALLLIARYREELRGEPSRFTAMGTALRRTASAIVASGGTVILAVLTLLLSDLAGNRSLGVAAAMGVAVAIATALVVLPAALVLFGRGLFWPFVPRVGAAARDGGIWDRIGRAVQRRPRFVSVAAVVTLLALAAGSLGVNLGLSQTEQFRVEPEAVAGAKTLAEAFPAGATQPIAVMTAPESVGEVAAAAEDVDGVESVRPGEASAEIAQIDVVLSVEPGTERSDEALHDLRAAVAEVPGSDAVVGGEAAANLDVDQANEHDRQLILPLILALVGLVLVLLLRCLLAPVLLVATVVLSYAASMGAAWLLFDLVLGFPALDSSVPLLAFVFLVALGVDYNIFLVTRAREDAVRDGTDAGMRSALRVTGGVITSAGVLLAAVFAVLGVLPLIVLTQIGIIVCIGVLLDTLLVRTVLVPALAFMLTERFWWPGRLR